MYEDKICGEGEVSDEHSQCEKSRCDKLQGLRNWLSWCVLALGAWSSHLSCYPCWGLVIHQEYVRASHPRSLLTPMVLSSSSHFFASQRSMLQ